MCASTADFEAEGRKISRILLGKIPARLDGKACINWMLKNGKQGKQMEWPGFYFEEFGRKVLIETLGGGEGPRFGKTPFDYKKDFVWDLKFHTMSNPQGVEVPWAILNDKEAAINIIDEYGGLGFVVGFGKMEFDVSGEFKKWHEKMKGGPSKYSLRRQAEGASSRKRKVSGTFVGIKTFFIESVKDLDAGRAEGWLGWFQEGMRNSNDRARRAKIMVNLDEIPAKHLIFDGKK